MLDVSRSMLFSGRFGAAQEEASKLLRTAEPDTALTVVTFSDDAGVAWPAFAALAAASPSGWLVTSWFSWSCIEKTPRIKDLAD